MIPKNLIASLPHERKRAQISPVVVESARADAAGVYRRFDTRPEGLSDEDADARRGSHGPNVLEKDRQTGIVLLFVHAVMNPLVLLLIVLASVSFATGDVRAGTMMVIMVVLGAGLKCVQEARADSAAAKLKAMISVMATVLRGGQPRELLVAELVPGVERFRHRGGYCHRERDLSGRYGRVAFRAGVANVLRQVDRSVHLADPAICAGDGAARVRHQRCHQKQLA